MSARSEASNPLGWHAGCEKRGMRFFLNKLGVGEVSVVRWAWVLVGLSTVCMGSDAKWPGRQPDGSVLLPNMWSLRPAGSHIAMEDFPVNIAVHEEGRFAAVLHAGFGTHQIAVLDLKKREVVQRTKLDETFYGLEFGHGGRRLYASGAGSEVVRWFEFNPNTGALGAEQQIALREVKERGIPAGMAVGVESGVLWVANVLGQKVARVELGNAPTVRDIALGGTVVARTPAADSKPQSFDEAAIAKRAEAALDPADPEAPYPYACRLDEKRHRLYVSLWAKSEIAVIDTRSGEVIGRWKSGDHPNEMVLNRDGKLLFVANANRNTVTVFDTVKGEPVETIWAAIHPDCPPGSTPNALALSPDERTLFIANANVNAVAVVDVTVKGKSRSRGFIPTGWYPTSVRVTPDGRKLLVANGKGISPMANPKGPQPGVKPAAGSTVEYIGGLFKGTVSVIDLPKGEELDVQLARWTADVYRCSPLKADGGVSLSRPEGNPIPGDLKGGSPIRYCIFVVKENRTYDQVFGDVKKGRGEPSLCLFPEKITPNHHRLAEEFVLFDNFYVESEVSADGHEWTMGAYATDYVEKFWPLSYGHNQKKKYSYPSEGNFPIATPAGGYLWDVAAAAGVTFRSYGEFVNNGKKPGDPAVPRLKSLVGKIDPGFRAFDMDYPDVKRAERFISELKRFESEGEMPRLQVVRLGNDHTAGTSPGKKTPLACVADNDVALGRVVEAVSHSKFWSQSAIFVVEDDAQNGPDHVDAHRTVALVASPYARRGVVDSTMYSTSSMLRTMELILGMRPMSQFDAAATPMYHAFTDKRDTRPFAAVVPEVDLEETNKRTAWGAERSSRMNFAKEDAADDLQLNEIIWKSIRGERVPMPSPVRASFVFTRPGDDDDDD